VAAGASDEVVLKSKGQNADVGHHHGRPIPGAWHAPRGEAAAAGRLP
jgi:hypothetical protein